MIYHFKRICLAWPLLLAWFFDQLSNQLGQVSRPFTITTVPTHPFFGAVREYYHCFASLSPGQALCRCDLTLTQYHRRPHSALLSPHLCRCLCSSKPQWSGRWGLLSSTYYMSLMLLAPSRCPFGPCVPDPLAPLSLPPLAPLPLRLLVSLSPRSLASLPCACLSPSRCARLLSAPLPAHPLLPAPSRLSLCAPFGSLPLATYHPCTNLDSTSVLNPNWLSVASP